MSKNLTYFNYIFWALLLLYIVIYAPFGFEDTDTGYIFGSSWQIYNGNFPYIDFNYIRPPIPPLFHTLFLFITEDYAYLLDRSFYYVQVFVYSFLIAKLVAEHFNLKHVTYFIATLGAIVSIHNYPPMGWNTIDGVFFMSIGCYFILKKKTNVIQLGIGALGIALGVLSKQSFYFMPLFLVAYLLLNKDYFRIKYVAIFGAILFSLFIAILYFTGSFNAFFEQTFSFTSSSSFVSAGIKNYYLALKFNLHYIIAVVAAFWLLQKYVPKKYLYIIFNIAVAAIMIYIYSNDDSYSNFKRYIIQLLFIAAALYALIMSFKDKKYQLLLFLLSLSWCASISNGFKTPIAFSLPIVFAIFLFFFYSKTEQFTLQIAVPTIVLYLITFYIGYQNIYRDSDRKELTYHMGDIYPQLQFIKSDKQTYNKYKVFKQFSETHDNFTVLPSMTLAHYLSKTVNPIGLDWVFDHEVGNSLNDMITGLESRNITVLVEKNTGDPCYENGECSQLTYYIVNNWKLIESNAHFKVYKQFN